MELLLSQFHLLRPYWLIALIPAFILFIALLKRRLASARWNGIIDEALMPHVLDQMPTEQSRWPLWFVLIAWVLAVIALSGPTWEKIPHPVQKKEEALVIVLDMSLSMAAQDAKPDRATRARQKVIDILSQRKEGLTALVVYAGDAYTVTPLTDDADTIINLVPALSPFIMPAMGSRPDKALALANKLVMDSGLQKADFLLITDGIQHKDISRITKSLGKNSEHLSILTIGTEDGAPIAMQGQGFMRDKQGNIVLPKLDLAPIKQLSSELDIRWHQMSFNDQDWQYLLNEDTRPQTDLNTSAEKNKALERQFDLWADQGYWLIPFILLIAAFSFRRGWMLSLVFVIGLQPESSYANDASSDQINTNNPLENSEDNSTTMQSGSESFWKSAWNTKNQQGQNIFKEDPASAAELFEDTHWKASSYYRAGEFEKAADYFDNTAEDSASGVIDDLSSEQSQRLYNRGNALAKAGKLEDAIKAYEQSLELNNSSNQPLNDSLLDDTQFNKQLVEELLKQQQEQQQDSDSKDSDSKDSDSKDSDSKDSDSKDSDSKDSDSKDSDSKDSDSKDSDSKDSDNNEDPNESDDEQESDSQKNDSEDQPSENDDDKKESQEEKPTDQSEEESKQKPEEQSEEQSAEQKNSQNEETDDLSREERQALEQWLNRIPDDPGGLLKRKFKYQYQQRDHQEEGEVSW